jgi:hypothetical protein
MSCSWPLATGAAEPEIDEAEQWIAQGKFNVSS